jgi:hypothetical protein
MTKLKEDNTQRPGSDLSAMTPEPNRGRSCLGGLHCRDLVVTAANDRR